MRGGFQARAALGLGVLMVGIWAPAATGASEGRDRAELIGTWRGTSTCTDRVAAPACRDEVVVYDFTRGESPETVHWKADKLVAGERQTMGELDLKYDADGKCWAVETPSSRFHARWCLAVDGARLTGTLRLLPGKEMVRKVEARND